MNLEAHRSWVYTAGCFSCCVRQPRTPPVQGTDWRRLSHKGAQGTPRGVGDPAITCRLLYFLARRGAPRWPESPADTALPGGFTSWGSSLPTLGRAAGFKGTAGPTHLSSLRQEASQNRRNRNERVGEDPLRAKPARGAGRAGQPCGEHPAPSHPQVLQTPREAAPVGSR